VTASDAASARRVLVVTYFFPPVGGVGVQRTLKFVMHLPARGWSPIVLAPRDPAYPLRDDSLLGTVPPSVEVRRTLSLEPTRLVQSIRRRTGLAEDRAPGFRTLETPTIDGLLGRARRRVLRVGAAAWVGAWRRILFPDEAIAWLPSAVAVGIGRIRRRSVAVLYSSSPPVSSHLIAGLLKMLTRRPWVADFRDPYVGNRFASDAPLLSGWLAPKTERWIVRKADRVVVAAEGIRDLLIARYPDLAGRVTHIPNGYDPSDLVGVIPEPPGEAGAYRIVFAGSLYRDGELDTFLRGVRTLLERRPDLRDRLRVEFVGRINEANAATAKRWLEAGLEGVVRFHGFVPRQRALEWMAGADALLQLMSSDPGGGTFVGGKLLEYLAFGHPILALMPPGEGRRLIGSLPGGITADLDPDQAATALEQLLDHPPAAGLPAAVQRYDRANLAGELAAVLDAVASR